MTYNFLNLRSKLESFSLLVFLLIFSLTSSFLTVGQSEALRIDDLSKENSESPFDALKGKKEDVSKRDAFSKHYNNDDGSYTALIGAGPIHYEKNGQFLDIDHAIRVNNDPNETYSHVNKTNLFESYFGATSNKGVKNITPEGEIREFLNTKMYWEVDGQAVNLLSSADVPVTIQGDKAYYNGLYGNISAEFVMLTGKRKLNYIIPGAQDLGVIPGGADYLVFSEDIELPNGWTYSTTEKGVYLKDETGKELYLYEKPNSTDASNELTKEENTIFETELNEDVLTIKTKVKTDWLLDTERVFPIKVDPTVNVYPNSAVNFTAQMNQSGGGTDGNPAAGWAGQNFRGYIKFNLSSIPASIVTNAQITLTTGNRVGNFNSTYPIGITQCHYDLPLWSNNYTVMYNNVTNPSNSGGDYVIISNPPAINLSATYNLVTSAYADIASKTGSINSFFAVTVREGWIGANNTNRYVVYKDQYDIDAPKLIVTYTQNDIYCHSMHQYANCAAIGDCAYLGISNISIGSINNTTTYNNKPIGYNNYSNQSTEVTTGEIYPLKVRFRDIPNSNFNPGKIAVWVDWNENGDFDGVNEYIGVSANTTSGNQLITFNITVPAGTTAGLKRLRVRSAYYDEDLSAGKSCTTLNYGETEDYTLNVIYPLPVQLTNFSATCGENVTLNWTTESERNSERFVIEKSGDGQTWRTVAEQSGAGNSTATINYSQVDENPWNGISYYRLRQIDFNGDQEVFGPISVSCDGSNNSLMVYPNPNNGSFTIEVASDKIDKEAHLLLMDVTGKVIVSKNVIVSNGTTQVMIDDVDLSNGVYLVTIRGLDLQLKPVKVIVNR